MTMSMTGASRAQPDNRPCLPYVARGRTNPAILVVLAERQPVGPNEIRSYVTPSRSKEEEEFPSLSHHPDGGDARAQHGGEDGQDIGPALSCTCFDHDIHLAHACAHLPSPRNKKHKNM